MDYIGAADYYYWQGVKEGMGAKLTDLPGLLSDMFVMKNKTTDECLDAYEWGFCLGQVLTVKEYLELTTPPEPVKIEYVEEEKEIKTTIQPKMVGNC